jgi:hypothetical protein
VTLPDLLAATIERLGPHSACALRIEVGRRKAEVLQALRDDPRFEPRGKGRSTTWTCTPVRSFDADRLLELHPDWTLADAQEIVRWLVDVGYAASINGNGRVRATELGVERSRAFCGLGVGA